MNRGRFIWLGLLVITFIAYAPLLRNQFINYDDQAYITNNKEVFNGLSWHSIQWAFTSTGKVGNWHPLTWLSLMLDCQLFGQRVWAHHLENLLWHAANTLLLFGLLRRGTAAPWRSAVVAALFAIHPLHVESVAWASERKDVLSTFFGLLSIAAYCRNIRRPSPGLPWLALIFFTLSLLCKPMLVTLPLLLLILDFWPLHRWTPRGVDSGTEKFFGGRTASPPFKQMVIEKLPFLVLSLVFSVIAIGTQHAVGAMVTTTTLPVLDRPVYALVAYATYLGKMIWPFKLVVMYPYPLSFPVWQGLLSILVLATITCMVILRVRKAPYLMAGWLWYLISLVPVIGLLQVGSQWYADRYTYLPLIGIFVAVVWDVADGIKRSSLPALFPGMLAAAAVLVCAMATWIQVRYWKDSLTLFKHTIAIEPNGAVSQHSYAQALASAGKQKEAAQHFQRALELDPDFPIANYGLGICLSAMGSNTLALECFQSALTRHPDYAQAHFGLASVLAQQGKLDEAQHHFEEALRLEPDYAAAHTKLGSLYVLQGKPEAAVTHYLAAIKLAPEDEEPQYCLAGTLARQKNFTEAVLHYRAAIKLKTNDVSALNDLAWILATEDDPKIRDAGQAVSLAQRACQLTDYDNPGYLDTLAAAYSETGRFQEAIETTQKAVAVADKSGHKQLVEKIRSRLPFYQQHISYRVIPGSLR